MKARVKIRLSSWYWGAYEWSDSPCCKRNGWKVGTKAHGYTFEEYNEEKHGWKNSEEYSNGQLKEYSI